MDISVIVPIKNEALQLRQLFNVIEKYPTNCVFYFCDGGCVDESFDIILDFKIKSPNKKIYICKNESSNKSILSTLLIPIDEIYTDYVFLHPVDIDCSDYFNQLIHLNSADYYVFKKRYYPSNILLTIQSQILNNIRLKLRSFVWTNGVFVKTSVLKNCKHLVNEFLEDVMLSDFLKDNYEGEVMPCFTICSSRRYIKDGVYKRMFINLSIMFLFRVFKVNIKTLKNLYYKI